jgi:flagellar motor protein MotB
VSFSDALAALVFVFMIVTAGFVLQLANAKADAHNSQRRSDAQVKRYTEAQATQEQIIREIAVSSNSCLRRKLRDILDVNDEDLRTFVDVDADTVAGRISLFLPGKGWFPSGSPTPWVPSKKGSADPIDSAIKALQLCMGETLAAPSKDARIRVTFEGHTDSQPMDTEQFPTNWELSAARGAALLRRFRCLGKLDNTCVPPDLPRIEFVAAGYAESVVAPRVLCEESQGRLVPRPAVVLSEVQKTCDVAVCAWFDQHGHDQHPDVQATQLLSSAVTLFLAGQSCDSERISQARLLGYTRAEEALSAWANAVPLCSGTDANEKSPCANRWRRLRRVDVRIEVMPSEDNALELTNVPPPG